MSSMLPSDIWNQFVSGDFDCFCSLFKGYYEGLYGYGLKLCEDSELVKDAIQNLFISVWERRDDLTHVTSPNVYLYVSLRRNILRAKKKKTRFKDISDHDNHEFDIHFGVEELIMKNESRDEQKENLQEALNHLSNKQKEVLYLHYYNGMSYGEIEKILSINRQSVRNHMYRAMETLRTVLDIDVMRLVISILIAVLFL
ncbi:MAG: sigma-70 family RNA polymerase sigma factor [Balneolaceae bacterium]|nr:sigma-70 family RNA polymerase sigma factor [Balneolaceae bacterium]MDR9409852.1 sigma-70 family RNA polymerase sigma factor [Balneolaceae bacterium]